MDIAEITKMIEAVKQIIEKNDHIDLPLFQNSSQLRLKGNNYNFILDLNRKGHRRPKCTFLLREKRNKEQPLVRVDIIGRPHQNPVGDFKWSNKVIPCPHLHRADFPKYGTYVAVPLLEKNENFQLSQNDLNNLCECLKKTLKFLNVDNINSYNFREQESLF